MQDVFDEVARRSRAKFETLTHDGASRLGEIDLPILWSSYEGQTVDALAVGGDEGRG